MLKVLSNILCDLDPKVKVKGQKAGICDGVPSTSALVVFIFERVHEIFNHVVCATSKGSDQPVHKRSLIRAFASFYSMSVKLLTKHLLMLLSLKGGCTCSSESTLVKMPHCRKSHVTAHKFYLPMMLFFTCKHVSTKITTEKHDSNRGHESCCSFHYLS